MSLAPREARFILTGAPVLLPDRAVPDIEVYIEGEQIRAVGRPLDMPADLPRVRVHGAWIAPGFIDIHTHGALGASFLDATYDAFATILAEQSRHGVTSVVPTTSTAPFADILATLEHVGTWMRRKHPETQVVGAHVEGPYFAAAQAGAQDPSNLRTPDDGSVDDLLAHADVIRIVSYAPELPGALQLTERLVRHGILAAAGHSEAEDGQVEACMAWGMRHAIHLWSAQSSTWRDGPYRRPGLLEASLASTHLTGEVIADGKHLPATLLNVAYNALGPQRLCAVSDATSGAGLEEGATFTMGGMTYIVEDGVGMMLDRSSFAGSTTLLGDMIAILVRSGIPLVDAVRMASATPASVLGLERTMGRIQPGLQADFAILASDLKPIQTIKRGTTIWNVAEGAPA